MAVDPESEVAQHLRAEPIAQADILEPDHAVLRKSPRRSAKGWPRLIRGLPATLTPRCPKGLPPGMVSNSLTDRLLGWLRAAAALIRRHADRLPVLRNILRCRAGKLAAGTAARCAASALPTVWHAEPSHADKLLAPLWPTLRRTAMPPRSSAPRRSRCPCRGFECRRAGKALPAGGGRTMVIVRRCRADHDGTMRHAAGEMQACRECGISLSRWKSPPIVPVGSRRGTGRPIDVDAGDSSGRKRRSRAEDIETVARAGRLQRRKTESAADLAAVAPANRHPGAVPRRCHHHRLAQRLRARRCRRPPRSMRRMGLPVNLRGLAFDGIATTTEQHEGVPILAGRGQHRQHGAQDRRRAAAQIRRAQRRASGNLFVDRGSVAHHAAAGRGRLLPHPARVAAAGRARRAGALCHPPRSWSRHAEPR